MEKTILDGDLWYIENFLTEEELNTLKPFCDDPLAWYTTMRSPYKNIINKFPSSVPKFDENGNYLLPDADTETINLEIFDRKNGIWERLESVLPPGYFRNSGIQTFKYCTDEEIERDKKEDQPPTKDIDFAMGWHFEEPGKFGNVIASHSIYLNDDFEGGELEFELGYIIKPKAGMLVNIPIGERFKHRVKKVLGPNSRHTLYGQCWSDSNVPLSTSEDC